MVVLTLRQVRQLLAFFGGQEMQVGISQEGEELTFERLDMTEQPVPVDDGAADLRTLGQVLHSNFREEGSLTWDEISEDEAQEYEAAAQAVLEHSLAGHKHLFNSYRANTPASLIGSMALNCERMSEKLAEVVKQLREARNGQA